MKANILIIIFSIVSAIIYILKIRDKYDLMYSTWNGSAWNPQMIHSTGYRPDAGSLVLDSNDKPHISYFYTDKVLIMGSQNSGQYYDESQLMFATSTSALIYFSEIVIAMIIVAILVILTALILVKKFLTKKTELSQ